MKNKTLFKAIGNINGKFIEENETIALEAHKQNNGRSRFFRKPLLVAAVIVILISTTITALAAAGVIDIILYFDPTDEPEHINVYEFDDGTIMKFVDPSSFPVYTITHADSGISLEMTVTTYLSIGIEPGYLILMSAQLQDHFLSKEEVLYIAYETILSRHDFNIDGLSGDMILLDFTIHDPDSVHWVVHVHFNEETPDIENDEFFFVEIDAVTGEIGDYFRHTPSSPAFVG